MPKMVQFCKIFEACGQTESPDRSVIIGQKLVENAKIPKFKCDILGNFQTLCLNRNQGSEPLLTSLAIPLQNETFDIKL